MNTESKQCQNCHNQFVIEPEDFQFYEKIKVPAPTWCPQCRTIRRFVFKNDLNLFRAQHAVTGKEIFSTYPAASGLKLYDHDYWWSDAWDPMRYGRDYDFSRPFFEQFKELLSEVPWAARSIWHLEGSDYCNNASRLKNCYLCFDCDESEDCFYGVGFRHSKNSLDFAQANYLESCYELFSCDRCYRTFFSVESDDCLDVWFSRECYNCKNCFGCINLRHKQYYIWNKPYSKEEYGARLADFNLGSARALNEMKERVRNFWLRFPVKWMHGTHNENVVGEYVYHAKNVKYCYQSDKGVQDLKYCQRVVNGVSTSYDYTHWGDNSELMYEAVTCGENCRNVRFCFECWPACQDLEYSMSCHASTNLFGCTGLKKKQYCILNKQYSREEFFVLRKKIIAQMDAMPYVDARGRVYRYGEFFPPDFSPLAYNEALAQEFFPLTEQGAREQGFFWRELPHREFETTLRATDLTDHIRDATGDMCKEIISCLGCSRAYRILAHEFEFYKRFGLPLPRLCHVCRYTERVKLRNPLKWHRRPCMCLSAGSASEDNVYKNTASHFHGSNHCPNEFETSYAPERPEIVYCEACYNAEVV